jgi:hypothetical protein
MKKRFTVSVLFTTLILLSLLIFSCGVQEQQSERGKTDNPYSKEEIDYFVEIAFGIEFGTSQTIKKWERPIRYQVRGSPTKDDIETLKSVMKDLETITKGKITFKKTRVNPNMTIYFVPVDDMQKYEPNYISGNWGFFYIWWNSGSEIYRARILIGTDKPNQGERNHLIREEITQSLGLAMDSWTYEESIFYQEWSSVQDFAEIDRKVIEILYREDITPGMTKQQVKRILHTD